MARPQVAGKGDGLQVWRVAANVLNKQSRTADKGLSSSLEVDREDNNSSHSKGNFVTKCYAGPWTLTDSLDKRPSSSSR
jgi:hypothetical protein